MKKEAKEKKPKKEKPEVPKIDKETIPGLQQVVKKKKLWEIIKPEHVWQSKGRNVRTIITHDGVRVIADFAGVSKNVEYAILTQPDAYNHYQYTMSAKVCFLDDKENCATEIGEANRNNLNTRGRNNPANMAQKRAYDRAVFRLLGITGILSDEELSDEETEENMEQLTHDEKKEIAVQINQLLLAKTQEDLILFDRGMKDGGAAKMNEKQKDFVRSLYQKRYASMLPSSI